jgi:hypothetical protein
MGGLDFTLDNWVGLGMAVWVIHTLLNGFK